MPVSWELNISAILAVVSAGFFVVRFWLFAGTAASDARESAREAHQKIALLQAAINAYQITQAERLVSREVLAEVEKRLRGDIGGLADRLDGLVTELIKNRSIT